MEVAWPLQRRSAPQASKTYLPIQTLMPPLYRKIKIVQLRQAWLRDPSEVLARYREATARAVIRPLQPGPPLDEMFAAILDHEEAEQSTSTVLRAIAA